MEFRKYPNPTPANAVDNTARDADGQPAISSDCEEHSENAGTYDMPRTAGRQSKIEKIIAISRYSIIAAAVILFALYCIKNIGTVLTFANGINAALCLILFTLVLLIAMPKLVRTLAGKQTMYFQKKTDAKRFLCICLIALAIHLFIMLIGAFMYQLVTGYAGGDFGDLLQRAWMKENIDAQHYIKIAENGYSPEIPGSIDHLLIVFFPMFPLMIRLFNLITANSFLSAQLINAIAVSLSAGVLYLTFRRIMDEKRALLSSLIFMIVPGAIFLNSPMTEPLFVLFSACCFYFMQDKKFILAGIFAALAGFTRSLGVLLAVAIAVEGISSIVRAHRNGEPIKKRILVLLAALLISTLGTLAYLGINYSVYGDSLRFMYYQKSHWSQSFSLFFDTPRYYVDYIDSNIANNTYHTTLSIFMPGLIAIFGSLAIALRSAKKLPASYTVYFLCYFAVAVGCTWLLSATRYLASAIPLFAGIGLECKGKTKTALIIAGLFLLMLGYMYMFMRRMDIY